MEAERQLPAASSGGWDTWGGTSGGEDDREMKSNTRVGCDVAK